MQMLGNYELTGQMSNQNSGYSVWCYGRRDGRDYFIKEFLSPKFPHNDTVSSPERIRKKADRCRRFEEKKTALYRVLNDCSDGNAVRVRDFFRIGTKYYIAMPRVQACGLEVGAVAAMDEAEKRRLCAIIAHSVAALHRGGLIHADLKPANILFARTAGGSYTAKLIDFDSSFLESNPPAAGEEIVGDQVYFSPEACLSVCGIEAPLSCKMDVFALGVLFHQYFCGTLPVFDQNLGGYPGEAVANGCRLALSPALPEDVAKLIGRMLESDPAARPTAMEVFRTFRGHTEPEWTQERKEPVVTEPPIAKSTLSGNPFFRPGDL